MQDPPYTAVGAAAMPGFLRDYLDVVARTHGRIPATFQAQVTARIEAGGLVNGFLIHPMSLRVRPRAKSPTSARAAAESICIRAAMSAPIARASSASASLLGTGATADDYYLYLAQDAGELFRLNCAELTGQTGKSVGRGASAPIPGCCLPPPERVAVDRHI